MLRLTNRLGCSFALVACLLAFPSLLSAQNVSRDQKKADELFKAGEWAQAVRLYEAVTQNEPGNARAWFQLGAAYHELGQYERASEAFDKAGAAGFGSPALLAFRKIRAYARAGNKDRAFEQLGQLVGNGFSNVELLKTHADLAALREDARFTEIEARAERNARPCDFNPENRRFDFWVGEWNVGPTSTPEQKVGDSSIQLILGNCIVFENWTGANGYTGKSFNLYNSNTKKWEQIWVDRLGGIIKFEGEFQDGVLHYYADAPAPNGGTLRRHLQFIPRGRDRVRQFSQQSTDGGKTWQVEYDLTYTRRTEIRDSGLPANDVDAIRALVQGYARAWLEGKPDAVMAAFLEEAVIMPHHGGAPREGAAAIRQFWWPPDSPPTRVTEFRITPDEISGLGDLAYVRGHFDLSFTMQQDSASKFHRNAGTFLLIARRNPAGEWRISRYMWDDPAQ